jgi:hypothetical protein
VLVDFDDPWGDVATQAMERMRSLFDLEREVIRLTGMGTPAALRDRLAFGERLRRSLNAVVEVEISRDLLSEGADGLIAGRTDLLAVTDGLPGDGESPGAIPPPGSGATNTTSDHASLRPWLGST